MSASLSVGIFGLLNLINVKLLRCQTRCMAPQIGPELYYAVHAGIVYMCMVAGAGMFIAYLKF